MSYRFFISWFKLSLYLISPLFLSSLISSFSAISSEVIFPPLSLNNLNASSFPVTLTPPYNLYVVNPLIYLFNRIYPFVSLFYFVLKFFKILIILSKNLFKAFKINTLNHITIITSLCEITPIITHTIFLVHILVVIFIFSFLYASVTFFRIKYKKL